MSLSQLESTILHESIIYVHVIPLMFYDVSTVTVQEPIRNLFTDQENSRLHCVYKQHSDDQHYCLLIW